MARSLAYVAAVAAACVVALCCPIGAAAGGDTLSWFTIGDWGATEFGDKITQGKVEKAMDTAAKSGYAPDMIINVGDNFYNNGVKSTTDSRWKETWEDVYFHHAIEVPWYCVLGNHDYIDNPQAQVEFSQQRLGDGRWNMPARYYDKTFTFGAGTTAHFLFLDTIMLGMQTTLRVAQQELLDGEITAEDYAMLRHRLAVDEVPQNATVQLQWLQSTLAASTADWIFVVGHFPVYSGGAHGSTPELQEQVKPLLEKYGVDAYMDGHDHTMQVLYSSGVYYFVSGSGSKTSHHMTQLPQTLYGVDDKPGFDHMQLNATHMTTSVFHDDGHIDFKVTQARRSKPQQQRRL